MEAQTACSSLFEVLVVDDRSTDGTADVVRGSPVARSLTAPVRCGSYAARNLGLAEAKAPILAFTDADCSPQPDWIERGLHCMAAADAEIVAGHIAVRVDERATIASLLDATLHLDQRRYASQGFGATANLWVKRSVVDRIGVFNDRLRSGGDKEFGLRATGAGIDLRYDERLVVAHPPRDRCAQLASKSYRLGMGAAHHVYRGEGSIAQRDRFWTHLRSYLPPSERPQRLDRLREQGVHPSRSQVRRMYWAQYFFMRLPNNFGGLVGASKESWRGRLRPSSRAPSG
jgi:glycosyltransferase involved in cell wall biosynthesis